MKVDGLGWVAEEDNTVKRWEKVHYLTDSRMCSLFWRVCLFSLFLLVGGSGCSSLSSEITLWQKTPTLAPTDTPESQSVWSPSGLPSFQITSSEDDAGIRRQAVVDTRIPERSRVEVITYEVQQGDNVFAIAESFSLKPETILWGNYEVLQDNPRSLQMGQELNILPVNGVYYQWHEGDKLGEVADFFGVKPKDILEYPGNDFDLVELNWDDPEIEVGKWLIIPGGKRALKDWGPPAITRQNAASASYYGGGSCGQIYEGAIGTGSFVWPTMATSLSGYDYHPTIHPAIDIAGAVGNDVFAADSGVVVYAGWSEYGYGYLIVLDHGNGWQSAYAHLNAVAVTCGQNVTKGTRIGAVGNTGRSFGSHLHFELRHSTYGKVNPWNFVSP